MNITVSGFIKRLNYSERFGNFSTYHHTFGEKNTIYNADASRYADFELVSLHELDETNTPVHEPISVGMYNVAADIINWLFLEATGSLTTDPGQVNQLLLDQFGSQTLSATVDDMLVDAENRILPNRITIVAKENIGSDTTYTFNYWLATTNFVVEYPNYDLNIFSYTDNVDDLVTNKEYLLGLIASMTLDKYNDKLNTIGTAAPYTAVRTISTPWRNKDVSSESHEVSFTFVCYGHVAGDDGLLKKELRDYIMANTKFPESVWEKTLPEIFTATTYMVIPQWDKIADGVGNNPIYNPICNSARMHNYFKEALLGYTDEHISAKMEIIPVLWQSIAMAVCGSIGNPVEAGNFSEVLEDYMLVDVGSPDFIRLDSQTKDFILKLNNMLPELENMTADSSTDMITEMIDGRPYYILTSFNLRCKIMAKYTYLELITEA